VKLAPRKPIREKYHPKPNKAEWEEFHGKCLGEIASDELFISKVMGIL